jgi:hypothetical protein
MRYDEPLLTVTLTAGVSVPYTRELGLQTLVLKSIRLLVYFCGPNNVTSFVVLDCGLSGVGVGGVPVPGYFLYIIYSFLCQFRYCKVALRVKISCLRIQLPIIETCNHYYTIPKKSYMAATFNNQLHR